MEQQSQRVAALSNHRRRARSTFCECESPFCPVKPQTNHNQQSTRQSTQIPSVGANCVRGFLPPCSNIHFFSGLSRRQQFLNRSPCISAVSYPVRSCANRLFTYSCPPLPPSILAAEFVTKNRLSGGHARRQAHTISVSIQREAATGLRQTTASFPRSDLLGLSITTRD